MVSVLLVLLVVLAVVWFGQRRMMYFPFGNVPTPTAAGLPQAELVTFRTDDGLTLKGWFVPAAAAPNGFTVIVFNGNGGHRALRAPLAAELAARGFATLLFDYRGYGDNPGSPSEGGLTRDALASLEYVARRPGVDARRIVYYGESLGTAVATRLAVDHPPAALVLRSPFTSIADIGQHHYPFLPVRWIARDRYPSIDLIGRVRCPVLVIAGKRDGLIPPSHSQRVYDAAPQPKRLLVIDADHNDYELLAGEELVAAIVGFVR